MSQFETQVSGLATDEPISTSPSVEDNGSGSPISSEYDASSDEADQFRIPIQEEEEQVPLLRQGSSKPLAQKPWGRQKFDATGGFSHRLTRISSIADITTKEIKYIRKNVPDFDYSEDWEKCYADAEKSTDHGLTSQEAQTRLEKFGRNELGVTDQKFDWMKLVWIVLSPAPIAMVIAGIVYTLTSEILSGCMYFSSALVVIIFTWFGEQNSGSDVSLEGLTTAVVKCKRDGEMKDIDKAELVPGDVIEWRTGDVISCDCKLLTSEEIQVNEVGLTGESEDVEKTHDLSNDTSEKKHTFPSDVVLSTCTVSGGKGTAVVFATGQNTKVGHMNAELMKIIPSISPLQAAMDKFGGVFGMVGIAVIVLMVLIGYFNELEDPVIPFNPSDRKRFWLSLIGLIMTMAVACIPITLITSMFVMLKKGIAQMADEGTTVKKGTAIDTLGCCSVICTDKTGTLTAGKMTACQLVTFDENYTFWPQRGPIPNGGLFKTADLSEAKRDLMDKMFKETELGQDFGAAAEMEDHISSTESLAARYNIMAAALNSYATTVEQEEGNWVTKGNMSEGAIAVVTKKAGIVLDETPYERTYEIAFSSKRKMAATIHKLDNHAFEGLSMGEQYKYVAVVKGAPDYIINHVTKILKTENNKFVLDSVPDLMEHVKRMAAEALRVLLVAGRLLTAEEFSRIEVMSSDDALAEILKGGDCPLYASGFFGLMDPLRTGVKEAVAKCHSAGIKVVMITGDGKDTATAIAKQCNISRPKTSMQIRDAGTIKDGLTPDICDSTCVWYRAQPMDKIAIVEMFQEGGHVAAMTGDGVNDAAALHKADIGIAMGITGSDVAKAEADVILMDDNFCTIVSAVSSGRRIFSNLQKFALFNVSCSMGELALFLLLSACNIPLPMQGFGYLILGNVSRMISPIVFICVPQQKKDMMVPPRKKASAMLMRVQVLANLVPYVLMVMVLGGTAWCYCLNTYIGTSSMDLLRGNYVAAAGPPGFIDPETTICQFAGIIEDGNWKADPTPYHCAGTSYAWNFGFASSKETKKHEQWGQTGDNIGPLDNFNSDFFSSYSGLKNPERYENPNWVPAEALERQKVDGEFRWVWKDESKRYNLPYGYWTQFAVMKARGAMGVIIITVELARQMSVALGRETIFSLSFTDHKMLLIIFVVQFVLLLVCIYVPYLNTHMLQVCPLYPVQFLTALAFALLSVPIDELIKHLIYRKRFDKRFQRKKYMATRCASGNLNSVMKEGSHKSTGARRSIRKSISQGRSRKFEAADSVSDMFTPRASFRETLKARQASRGFSPV